MYKGKIAAGVMIVLLLGAFTGYRGDALVDDLGETIGDSVKEAVTDVKKQVSDEIKSALVKEIKEYITSDEMSETLGISAEEQENIINSVRDYIDHYEFDAEQMKEAKDSVEELLQNTKGLSADEIKENIAKIFENHSDQE